MVDVSGHGLRVLLIAIPTFPAGIDITEFTDDVDALNSPNVTIREWAMGLNGDLITWKTPNAVEITLGVIPNSEADKNLGILFDVERPGKNKLSLSNNISLYVQYPDGKKKLLALGVMTGGPALSTVTSDKRIQSKEYSFVFEGTTN